MYILEFAELSVPLIEAVKGKYHCAPHEPLDEKTDTNVPRKRKRIKLTAKWQKLTG